MWPRYLRTWCPGQYHFGDGLYLIVEGGSARWKTRYQKDGKPRWHSLLLEDVANLVEARRRHGMVKQQIADGDDPALERKQAKKAAKELAKGRKTFRQCAEGWEDEDGKHVDGYLDSAKNKWKDHERNGRKKRRRSTYDASVDSLENYVCPIVGDLDVSEIDRHHIKAIASQPSLNDKGKMLWDIEGMRRWRDANPRRPVTLGRVAASA
jgi:hypothetical protein